MMRRASPDTDQISRSLLQKAVRRGDVQVTQLVIKHIIQNNDFDWLRKRLAVVTFEECWIYGSQVSYEKDEKIITFHYSNIAQSVKNKDAAGLGSLAYALSQGDTSVLSDSYEDKAIKIIAEAIKRPKDFWEWIKKQKVNERQERIVESADKGFRKAGWPWDRAFAQSAAYLSVTTEIPQLTISQVNKNDNFPFWVGIDKHTAQGKAAIRQAAKQIEFNANKALWLAFYFESAKCNVLQESLWWQKEVSWRMKKLELSLESGKLIWEKLQPIVKRLLEEDAQQLEEKILKHNPNNNFKSTSSTINQLPLF